MPKLVSCNTAKYLCHLSFSCATLQSWTVFYHIVFLSSILSSNISVTKWAIHQKDEPWVKRRADAVKSGSNDFDSTLLDTVVYVIFLCHLKVSFIQSVIKIWLKVFMASTKKARFNKNNNQCLPRREQSITKAQLHQNGVGGGRRARQQLNVQLVFFIWPAGQSGTSPPRTSLHNQYWVERKE